MTSDALNTAQRIIAAAESERAALAEAKRRYPVHAPDNIARAMRGFAHSVAVLDQWQEVGRQVLALHPDLLATVRTAGSSKIVPEVFAAIPYISPLVVFPDAPVLPSHTPGETMRMLGFIACGRIEGERTVVVNTHAQGVTHFAAEIVLEVCGADGSRDIEMDYISFPVTGGAFTVDEAVTGLIERFQWAYGDSGENSRAFMGAIVRAVLGSALYLASKTLDDDRDSQRVPPATVRKLTGARKPPFSFYRVGWQIGAALSNAGSAQKFDVSDPAVQGRTGHEQDPQHRRAHFKTVWTGPRRSVPKTAFVAPYWTHVEKMGPRGVNTVRKVAAG